MTAIKQYSTSEIAKRIGIHPNTVRLYEKLGLISLPQRKTNGYRVFTEVHLYQLRIARTAFAVEVLQNGLRKKITDIVKTTARGEYASALTKTDEYIKQTEVEIRGAHEAVDIVKGLFSSSDSVTMYPLKRHEVSVLLGISMDTLRSWEMNRLLKAKRKENGYRIYMQEDVKRLKVIRTLKCANYSLSAILRMLNSLDRHEGTDISALLGEPSGSEDIISACDRLVLSLNSAKKNACVIKTLRTEIQIIK